VKALSDVICTSSNAVRIVAQASPDKPVLFAPDRYLGAYVKKQTRRDDILLWQGTCIVHETFSARKIAALEVEHQGAVVIAHPECDDSVLSLAKFVGSTSALIRRAVDGAESKFIVATEPGILHQMRKQAPHKTFIPAPPEANCHCNECPFMRLNTLEKIYLCMKNAAPAIHVDPDIRRRALKPITRMLELTG